MNGRSISTAGTLLTMFYGTAVNALSTGIWSRCSRAKAALVSGVKSACWAPATMMNNPANISKSDQSISA
jgi:hypothetical protein